MIHAPNPYYAAEQREHAKQEQQFRETLEIVAKKNRILSNVDLLRDALDDYLTKNDLWQEYDKAILNVGLHNDCAELHTLLHKAAEHANI